MDDNLPPLTEYSPSFKSGRHGNQKTLNMAHHLRDSFCSLLPCHASIRPFYECTCVGLPIHGRLGDECARLASVFGLAGA